MSTVTVLSGPERRRRWSLEQKREIVAESLAPGASVAAVARRHDLHPNLIHVWRREARSGALTNAPQVGFAQVAVRTPDPVSPRVIEVVLRNGRLLRLWPEVSAAHAGELADALEGSPR